MGNAGGVCSFRRANRAAASLRDGDDLRKFAGDVRLDLVVLDLVPAVLRAEVEEALAGLGASSSALPGATASP